MYNALIEIVAPLIFMVHTPISTPAVACGLSMHGHVDQLITEVQVLPVNLYHHCTSVNVYLLLLLVVDCMVIRK